jgi:hypothetical protein
VELLTFSIAAGETKVFQRAGRYFEIIEASAPLNVELVAPDGAQGDDMRGAVSGMYSEGPFSHLEIGSGQAQTVTVMLSDGRGGSRRQPGSVRIIDEITDALQVFYFSPALAPTAYVSTVIVAPASNTKGVIVRAAQTFSQAGVGSALGVGFVAARSLPTGYQVPPQRWLMAYQANATTQLQERAEKSNKLIPPGWGLYAFIQIDAAAAATSGNGTLACEVLQ